MLRRSDFSDKWPIVPLSEVITFLDNLRKPVKSSERVEGDYAYYGANGLQGSIDGYLFDEPLVLLAEDGGHFGNPGRDIAYIATGKYWVNNHAHVLKPKDNIDLNFLCRVLQRYDVTPFIKGATRAKLTKGDASRIPIPLPPLPEQKRIAALLDKADQLRQKRQQAITLADDFLRSVFLDMFGDPVTNPKGWEVKPAKDVLHVQGGYAFSSSHFTASGIPVVKIGNANKKGFTTENIAYVDPEDKSRLTQYELYPSDLLMSLTGTVGKDDYGNITEVSDDFQMYYLNQRVAKIHVQDQTVSKLFLKHYFKHPRVKSEITKNNRGVRQANISNSDIYSLNIPIPSLQEQKKYEQIDKYLTKIIRASINFNQLSKKCFNALSQKAFAGEL